MKKPEIFSTFKDYNLNKFYSDLSAGVIVGIVALPLAIAFGIASGVTPSQGLITAIIAGFLVSALGGSKVQIGGPTGAFVIIVFGIIQEYGITGLTIATVMAGVILILMGLIKFGSLIKFIPFPVVVGFTSGIAVLIFSTQIKDFFGLTISNVPAEFHEKWFIYLTNIAQFNIFSLGIGIASILIIIFWQKITYKIPGSIISIILSTLIVQILNLPVDTIGSRFGTIPSTLPSPTFYEIDFNIIKNLIGPATTIALLAAIESLLSAVVADGMIGGKHKSNTELIAQGFANIGSAVFGGIPATGAIARTATNIRNGGRTPIAGIIHSLVLLLIMLFFGEYAKLIPMPTLAAILIVVAYNMSEWRSFKELMHSPKSDIVVLLTTFFLTVVFDITLALEVGMVMAVFLFMKRMAEVTNVGVVTRELHDADDIVDPNAISQKLIPPGVDVFEINGPFFFGAASKFKDEVQLVGSLPKVRIIRMRNVPAIDATGMNTLRNFYYDSKKKGIHILLSGVHAQPLFAMTQSGLLDIYGEDNIFGNIDDALDRAREILGLPKLGRPMNFIPTVKRDLNSRTN